MGQSLSLFNYLSSLVLQNSSYNFSDLVFEHDTSLEIKLRIAVWVVCFSKVSQLIKICLVLVSW